MENKTNNRQSNMRRQCATYLMLAFAAIAMAQPQAGYYTSSTLDGKNGRELELALKAIVYPHTRISYDDVWDYYPTTDLAPASILAEVRAAFPDLSSTKTDLVYDMYAWPTQFPKFYSDNDHSQTGGFNREHAVPNSWWGGKTGNTFAYSDLHHLMPADGAANSAAKSDYPLGEYVAGQNMTLGWPVANKTNTSGVIYARADTFPDKMRAASHRWDLPASIRSQYGDAAKLFEPADEYKGDFARMYLYVVCAYEGELTWQTTYMFTSDSQKQHTILPWAKELLLKWHRQDPVSEKERNRNNAVEGIQGNRNPFIDYPDLVEYIWGNKTTEGFSLANAVSSYSDSGDSGEGGETPGGETGGDTPGGEETGKTPSTITFVLTAHLGQPFGGFIYSSDSNGAATYSSSNTSVAEVNATTGEVTIKAVGETTITYSIAETASFNAAEDHYIIRVVE